MNTYTRGSKTKYYTKEENDRFCLNSGTSGNDIMDAFEGVSDALWNVD